MLLESLHKKIPQQNNCSTVRHCRYEQSEQSNFTMPGRRRAGWLSDHIEMEWEENE